MRLDVYLSEKSLCKSRTEAQRMIAEGGVLVNGKAAKKPSADIGEGDKVELIGEPPKYVGRGGLKLEKGILSFGVELSGAVCVDIGASTGGFTDCMLRFGAARVYSVDVGREQLSPVLREDDRVISLEQTDIRDFSFDEYPDKAADFVGTDVSFISLKLVLPHIYRLLRKDGAAVALIKPQFEAGRAAVGKRGIVRDEKVHKRVVEDIAEYARQLGFEVAGVIPSPITGGDGNKEFLLGLKRVD